MRGNEGESNNSQLNQNVEDEIESIETEQINTKSLREVPLLDSHRLSYKEFDSFIPTIRVESREISRKMKVRFTLAVSSPRSPAPLYISEQDEE